jgi:adenine-specific DNA-methyltransferase
MPNNNHTRRKKDSARLIWDSKPRRAPNPKDIEFQTAEVVIPNPHRDQTALSYFTEDLTHPEIDKSRTNRLIWGDNLLVMQTLLAQGYEGKINLIYIDPPFWTGENYYANFVIEGESVTKSPSVIERLAYKDIWTGGIDSFLDMLYPRLQLMKRLLADKGSIYVHCDWHIGHYIKVVMDEVFGKENFKNHITWKRSSPRGNAKKRYPELTDYILLFSKSDDNIWNYQYAKYRSEYLDKYYNYVDDKTGKKFQPTSLLGHFGVNPIYEWKGITKPWRYPKHRLDELDANGEIYWPKGEGIPRFKRFLDEQKGVPVQSLWDDIPPVNSQAKEDTSFPTQKPASLLERIILASSNEGDLVADFFPGSGTTLAVAEKLNRRWIGSDFSKVAIQIIRNRLVNQDAKPFLIENIGNYQRQMIYLHGARIYEMQRIILKLYGATPRKDFSDMGMKKAEDGVTELVWVSYPDRPVPSKKVEELARRADHLDGRGFKRLVILGWDYEYNYNELLDTRKRADKWFVQVVSKNIPPEVYEYLKKAKSEEEIEPLKEKIFFHEKPYLKVLSPVIETSSDKAKVTVGIDKYVLFDIPIEKEKERLKVIEIARDNFAALLDYWAVDWDYDGLTFKSEWQAFRGFGKKVKTVPTKTSKELERGREYSIAIRVVDIFGNDATAVVDVDLRGA